MRKPTCAQCGKPLTEKGMRAAKIVCAATLIRSCDIPGGAVVHIGWHVNKQCFDADHTEEGKPTVRKWPGLLREILSRPDPAARIVVVRGNLKSVEQYVAGAGLIGAD